MNSGYVVAKGMTLYRGSKVLKAGEPVPLKMIPHTPKQGKTFKATLNGVEVEYEHGHAIPANLLPEDMTELEVLPSVSFEKVEEEPEEEIQEKDVPF